MSSETLHIYWREQRQIFYIAFTVIPSIIFLIYARGNLSPVYGNIGLGVVLVAVCSVVLIPVFILPLFANRYWHLNLSILGYGLQPDLYYLKSSQNDSECIDPELNYWRTPIHLVEPVDFTGILGKTGKPLYPGSEVTEIVNFRHYMKWEDRVFLHEEFGTYKSIPAALKGSETVFVRALDPQESPEGEYGKWTVTPTFELIFAPYQDSKLLGDNQETVFKMLSLISQGALEEDILNILSKTQKMIDKRNRPYKQGRELAPNVESQ